MALRTPWRSVAAAGVAAALIAAPAAAQETSNNTITFAAASVGTESQYLHTSPMDKRQLKEYSRQHPSTYIIYFGENIVDADISAQLISENEGQQAIAIPGWQEADKALLIINGKVIAALDQSELNRAQAMAHVRTHLKQVEVSRLDISNTGGS